MAKDIELEKKMYTQVELWKQSGMKMVDYARKLGVHKDNFRYWVNKKKYADMENQEYSFVKLEKSAQPAASFEFAENPALTRSHVVLSFPSGLRLEIFG
jgi:uncharacterized protein YjcR